MSIVPISRQAFDRHTPSRGPMSALMVEEVEWYAGDEGVIIGLVGMDTTDKDWMYVVHGPDQNGSMRAISVDSSIDTQEKARTELLDKMTGFAASGDNVFPQ